ncbi:hypothetical protein Tco_0839155 [Tanacetum coccineum]|uniref:Uncharacterized protein n=1 Tax=Tanacetum coccineum TaxID=301880 RepID=A0ABQ5ATU3_9ASTR
MYTYLKNMEEKKPKDLKNKSFDSISKMFDRAFKRVNTFVDFRTDLVEGSSKRAGEELEQETTKNLMLKSFSREDLEDLYDLVKAKYKSTRPVEDLDLVLWSDLYTMFKPHIEDEIWKLQQSITGALIDVNADQSKLVLLKNFNENYSKCLRLLVKLLLLKEVTTTSSRS